MPFILQKYSRSIVLHVLCLGLTLSVVGCTRLSRPPGSLARTGNGRYIAQGSPGWWKGKKKEAIFEVGKGFKVPGVDGYFDDQGRPVNSQIVPVVFEEEATKPSMLDQFGADGAIDKIKNVFGQGKSAQESRARFAEGRKLYEQKKYIEAAGKFATVTRKTPDSNIQQASMFLTAECYYFADSYPDAVTAYQELLKKYPSTKYLNETINRQWKIAQFWQKLGEKENKWATTPNGFDKTIPTFDTQGHAIALYDSIRMNDPTGPWADDALMATASSHFVHGRYSEADQDFKLLRSEYNKSQHQYIAHVLGLQCKLHIYQGPNYDPTPLDDAEKLLKRLQVQFASRLTEKQRKEVVELSAKVERERANRDWTMAEYFADSDHFGAAKMYYAKIASKYPDTELGKKSKERLAKIKDEPDSPKETLDWLIKYFPESRMKARLAVPPKHGTILK